MVCKKEEQEKTDLKQASQGPLLHDRGHILCSPEGGEHSGNETDEGVERGTQFQVITTRPLRAIHEAGGQRL